MNNFTFYSPLSSPSATERRKHRRSGAAVRRHEGAAGLRRRLRQAQRCLRRGDRLLAEAGIPFEELSGIQANPRSGKVYEGIDLVRRTGADFLLALGGGSVIDTAKAIGFGVPGTTGTSGTSSPARPRSNPPCRWAWC